MTSTLTTINIAYASNLLFVCTYSLNHIALPYKGYPSDPYIMNPPAPFFLWQAPSKQAVMCGLQGAAHAISSLSPLDSLVSSSTSSCSHTSLLGMSDSAGISLGKATNRSAIAQAPAL